MSTTRFNFENAPYTWILAHIHYSSPNGYYYFDLEEATNSKTKEQIITAACQAGMSISFNLFYYNIADPEFSRKEYDKKEYTPINGCYFKSPEDPPNEKQEEAAKVVWIKLIDGAYDELKSLIANYYVRFGDDYQPFLEYIGTWNVMPVYKMYVKIHN